MDTYVSSQYHSSCSRTYGISANNADPVVTPNAALSVVSNSYVEVDTSVEGVYTFYVYATT